MQTFVTSKRLANVGGGIYALKNSVNIKRTVKTWRERAIRKKKRIGNF